MMFGILKSNRENSVQNKINRYLFKSDFIKLPNISYHPFTIHYSPITNPP